MRAFIAIEIPDDIREAIAETQAKLKNTRAKVSWTKPANIHLTLKFLGEISEEQCAAVQAALTELTTHHSPFTVTVVGAGGFPSARSPRVLWIGCEEPTGVLAALQSEIEAALEKLGFPAEQRGFTAHLT